MFEIAEMTVLFIERFSIFTPESIITSHFTLLYLDPHDDNKIGVDGIQQFCNDLTLDPTSISVLLIAWKFRAATQCEFSKQEFMDGMAAQG